MNARSISGIILATALLGISAVARGADETQLEAQPGPAAAHRALEQAAGLPTTSPQLPAQASDRARGVLADTGFGAKGDAIRAAQARAEEHIVEDAESARSEATNRAAHAAAAAAASSAVADSHVAATQVRATSAKANAAGHSAGRLDSSKTE